MSNEIESPPTHLGRVTRRRTAIVAVGASAILAALGASQLQNASAEPVDSSIAAVCTIGGSAIDVTVPLTVDDKIDPVVEGGHETLETRTGLPALPIEVTINKLVVTTPIPTQIASTDAVTFTGGNVTGSYEISGTNLIVTFTGPVSSSQIQVPTVTAEQTVASGIGATTINWLPFSQIDADTNYGMATCTPNDPNQIVNATTVHAASAEPTTPPTTAPTDPSEPSEPTEPTTPPTTEPTTPPTTEPSTPPTTQPTPPAPAPRPGLPVPVPGGGVPVPVVPVPSPAPPSLPAPSLPSVPSVPTPGNPSQPCPVVPGLPGLPLPTPCPTLPPAPAPTVPSLPAPDIDADVDVDVDLTVGIGF